MVECFIITAGTLSQRIGLHKACVNLPEQMTFEVISYEPYIVKIIPIDLELITTMAKDDLHGKKGAATRQHYINTIKPFFRQYCRDIDKMEIDLK